MIIKNLNRIFWVKEVPAIYSVIDSDVPLVHFVQRELGEESQEYNDDYQNCSGNTTTRPTQRS